MQVCCKAGLILITQRGRRLRRGGPEVTRTSLSPAGGALMLLYKVTYEMLLQQDQPGFILWICDSDSSRPG